MKIVPINEANSDIVVEVLKSGGLVIFPSETTYGVAVDASSIKSVNKLSEYKQRPVGKPYSIMVNDIYMAKKYAHINKAAENIYINFLPGPVTVISKGKHKLANGVESETGTLGIRMPDYPWLLELISKFNRPLTATSANPSYKKRPYSVADILDNLSDKQKLLIDLIIDAGELPHNEPSTVIDTTLDDPITLRQGHIRFGLDNQILTRTEEETKNFGKEMWQKYFEYAGKRAIVYALKGPMGAGKTQFAKGLAKAAGIQDQILSPTFNIELGYTIPTKNIKFLHLDAWRLHDGDELLKMEWKQKINERSVIVIEWADRVADAIRNYEEDAIIVWIELNYGKEENHRIIKWNTV